MSCANYVPPLVEQLHGPDPTAGSDCAIACAAMAIRFATCEKVNPNIDKVREQSGLDEPNPPPDDYSTTMSEYAKAVNAFDGRAKEAGFSDGIGASVKERGPWDSGDSGLAPTIRAEEKWVTVFVDYGVLNDREPSKSGDKGFRGSHAVSVFGYTPKDETSDGTAKCKVFDPLCDGRRAEIPKGPTWWKMSTMQAAADAYAGGGSDNATWCVTPRSKSSDPEPVPPPCKTAYASDRAALLQLVYEQLREGEGGERLAELIREHQGDNPEGLELPVHSGVKPDS
jgi:hypothetical protein